jgi:hypothetical protein
MQELLTSKADEIGRSSGFIERERKLKGSTYAQSLVFGWMANPAATVSELAQSAASVGVSLSKQGLAQRFSEKSARFMQHLFEQALEYLVQGEPMSQGVFRAFSEVHVLDSTSISLPETLREVWTGCNTQGTSSAAVKISVDWELLQGCLTGVHWQAAKHHDQHSPLAKQDLPNRALLLRDLGYFNLKDFARLDSTGRYYLSRLKANCRLYTLDGHPFDWATALLQSTEHHIDRDVLVGADRLRCRLVAWRVPDEVADWRCQQLRQAALDKGRSVCARRVQTAAWSVYITNVSADLLSLEHIQILAKVRWQIEVLFKLWKSDGLLDEWRTADPWRALTECFAKLLALLIQHWCILLGSWHLPNRSLHQALQLLRKHAFHLACALSDMPLLCRTLSIIQAALSSCRMSSLRKRPHTFQLVVRGSLA